MIDSKRTWLLCAAFFTLGASLSLVMRAPVRELVRRPAHAQSLGQPIVHTDRSVVPPCGRIEAIQVPLANSDGVFPDREHRLASPKWLFEDMSESRLTRFLNSCDLRPSEQRNLLDKRTWEIRSDGIVISPSEQLIWSLTPQSREQIYSILARSPANFPQCYPFRFPVEGFDQRFRQSDLPIAEVEKIKRLTYTNAGYLCFTDLEVVKGVLTGDQFKDLIETLYQLPAYFLRLHVTADSDVEALIKYWGKGGREKMISPLLNSMAKNTLWSVV